MSYFAKLNKKKIVINISVGNADWDSTGWIEYTDENPAVIGGDYVDGYFYEIQPYASWTRDKGIWVAPIPRPTDGKFYTWNEETLTWDLNETIPE
jgi:hypothetical protein